MVLLIKKLNGQEIDILEQYADNPSLLHTTLHYWPKDGGKNWGVGVTAIRCDMTSGFHTYGLDLQPDYLTFYYDRLAIWQMPNIIPGYGDKYDRKFYVMINLALESWITNITSPQDYLVKYVKVWQGSGGSQNGFDTAQSDSITWPTAGFNLTENGKVVLKNITLTFQSGDLIINTQNGQQLWHTATTQTCTGTGCIANFQNDGNFVFSNNGKVYWSSSTWDNNMGSLTFFTQSPYLEIRDGPCNIKWSTWH